MKFSSSISVFSLGFSFSDWSLLSNLAKPPWLWWPRRFWEMWVMGATSALARASAIALALAALLAALVPPCAGAGAGGAPPEVLDFLCFGAMVLLLFVTP